MLRYCFASAVALWVDPGMTVIFLLAVLAGAAHGAYTVWKEKRP